MKTKFTLLAALIVAFFGANAQQLENASFNTWTNALHPDGWATYESAFGFNLGLTSRDTIDKLPQFGPASISIKSDSIPGFPQYGVFPGLVSTGTGSANPAPSFVGVPFTHRPDTLVLVYKYVTPNGTDTAVMSLTFRGNNTTIFSGALTLDTTSQWALVTVPLGQALYGATAVPDSILVQFSSSNRAPKKGSNLHLEAVGFVYASATGIVTTTDPTTFCVGESADLTAVITNGNPAVTYQWLKNGAPINGATSLTYTATESGNYAIEVSNGDAVDTSSFVALTAQACTGIEAVNAANVSVFPNPVATTLNITSTENLAGFELNLIDVNGRTVLTQVLSGNANAISVNDLAKGTYLYTIGNSANGVILKNSIQIQR